MGKDKRVSVVTLGCAKNTVDSEILMAQLRRNGWEVLPEEQALRASVVIVNTCGFIASAKEESINTILAYCAAKEQGGVKQVFVFGCLAQRYADELRRELPEVDGIYGVSSYRDLLRAMGAQFFTDCAHRRLLSTPRHYAYLKIAEGCNWHCAYCAIPLIRGPHRSRPMEELLEEAERLAAQGVKELIVIAQDSTYYGLDLYGARRLPELLDRLAAIDGLHWVRLHYAYPAHFPMELLDVMARNPKICKYLDIPFQHISDHMLKAMRRHVTAAETLALIAAMRAKVPGLALRTTLITGFPGETEADFAELKEFVQNVRFERLGVFAYSDEDGTPAADLTPKVPEVQAQRRADAIMEMQRDISLQHNQKQVGEVLEAVVDSVADGQAIARTEYDSPEVDQEVAISLGEGQSLSPGQFVQVRITGAADYDLTGELVG